MYLVWPVILGFCGQCGHTKSKMDLQKCDVFSLTVLYVMKVSKFGPQDIPVTSYSETPNFGTVYTTGPRDILDN